jgi:hypothetical protein
MCAFKSQCHLNPGLIAWQILAHSSLHGRSLRIQGIPGITIPRLELCARSFGAQSPSRKSDAMVSGATGDLTESVRVPSKGNLGGRQSGLRAR